MITTELAFAALMLGVAIMVPRGLSAKDAKKLPAVAPFELPTAGGVR